VIFKTKIFHIFSSFQPGITAKSPEDALGFLLQNNLSKEQYLNMKQACSDSGANIWPNYNKVLAAKSSCRPVGIILQDHSAEVPLQNLLNHTADRILNKVCISYRLLHHSEFIYFLGFIITFHTFQKLILCNCLTKRKCFVIESGCLKTCQQKK
jgi:hypothetical protein